MVRKIEKKNKVGLINIENAQVGYKNFSGKVTDFNKDGSRNFVVFLDEKMADDLASKGWNIKEPKKSDDPTLDYTPQPYLPVTVSFEPYPPKMYLISGDNHKLLGEDEVEILDWSEIQEADIVIRPYEWEVNGNSGVKAYVKSMYITLNTDSFAKKYGIY